MDTYTKLIVPRNDLSIRRSYLVEVPIGATVTQGTKPEFQRDNLLNPNTTGSVIFTGMEVYTNDFLTKAPSGADVITPTEAAALVVTLAWGDDEFIRQEPLIGLIAAVNFGMIRRLDRVKIEMTKSYLTILAGGVITPGRSAIFNFFFDEPAGTKKKK